MLAGALFGGGPVDLASYAPLLVPAATAFVGWLAFLGAKRGNRVEESQQQARNRIDERAQTFTELGQINERLQGENDRLRAYRDDEAARAAAVLARRDAELRASQERCRRQIDGLVDQLQTVRSALLNEVMRASIDTTVRGAFEHTRGHDDLPGVD